MRMFVSVLILPMRCRSGLKSIVFVLYGRSNSRVFTRVSLAVFWLKGNLHRSIRFGASWLATLVIVCYAHFSS